MWTISKAILIALLITAASQLYANGINNPKSGGSRGGNVGFVEGINNLGIGGKVTPCSAGQLVFSDACNTTQYMVILK